MSQEHLVMPESKEVFKKKKKRWGLLKEHRNQPKEANGIMAKAGII